MEKEEISYSWLFLIDEKEQMLFTVSTRAVFVSMLDTKEIVFV